MDSQHRKLIDLCNALADCAIATDEESDSRFHDILNDLAEYARNHFAAEEKLLAHTGYADLEAHCADHGNYESDLADFLFSATISGSPNKAAVHRFVLAWWMNHILKADMAYRDHLLAQSN